ncbi:MAG: serine/threonine-protein kinase, partial [Candidatus Aminicenantaceae bacterium]
GMSLGSSRFDEELRSFLQRRLRILTTTVAILLCLLSVSFVITLAADPAKSLGRAIVTFCTTFPNDALFFMTAASSILAFLLWVRRAGPTSLNITDALFLQVLILPCLLLYAQMHHFLFPGFAVVVPFLMLFILARAILIPSKAWWTVLLSSPAALGVFVIQLQAGNSFISPGQAYGEEHFVNMVMQNQVLLLGSIAIAATASRVNLGLRRQNFNARHVGQYKIERLLGTGGMGEVYIATHSLLKRPTAIKFLRPDIAGDQTLVRFEQEVKHSSRLSHPNNISIFDYGHTAEGIFYYAMELLRGANLRRIVNQTGVMPAGRVIHILAGVCGALWEAHSLGIIHRDIKPENVMLCEQGCEFDVVKVLDFGLVKDVSAVDDAALTGEGNIAGTPLYMAPEALTSPGNVDARSDVYAVG